MLCHQLNGLGHVVDGGALPLNLFRNLGDAVLLKGPLKAKFCFLALPTAILLCGRSELAL